MRCIKIPESRDALCHRENAVYALRLQCCLFVPRILAVVPVFVSMKTRTIRYVGGSGYATTQRQCNIAAAPTGSNYRLARITPRRRERRRPLVVIGVFDDLLLK